MTKKTLLEIRRRNEAGETDTQIADALGLSLCYVNVLRMRMGLPRRSRPGGQAQKLYFVWREKDDALVGFGTAQACAQAMGIKPESFYSAVCRAASGRRNSRYRFLVEEMEDDDREK